MKTIYLTGFMGSGKSAAGWIAANLLNVPCFDLDAVIEKNAGKTIKELFEQEGEASFRLRESVLLQKMPKENCVVITGGGLPADQNNREYMMGVGHVVYLKTSFKEIMKRLTAPGEIDKRPVLKEKTAEEIELLYNKRKSFYEECSMVIATDGKTPQQVAEEMVKAFCLN
ncbi:shikimate kinase [Fictibacillus iocasae]|uniref:Shikimate kinase n=1 Tax=Fictibacillus iocasae TaxID=2715437 RepID=A0ABW2NQT0_9BACL